MCDPTTLAVASIGSSIIGGVQQAQAAKAAGAAQAAQANYQAAVARNNKIIADRKAEDAIKRGKVEELQYRQQVSQLTGRQRAVLAGNGVVIDQGSALDITEDTAARGEFDALTIRSNAEREAYDYRVQGQNFESNARLYDATASNALAAGKSAATGALITGAGSVAQKWYGFKKEGVFG